MCRRERKRKRIGTRNQEKRTAAQAWRNALRFAFDLLPFHHSFRFPRWRPSRSILAPERGKHVVSGSLVADLGIGPEVWLFLSLLGCVTLYFKFSRVWSVRNLDLLLLFVLAPGLMMLVGNGGGGKQPWVAFGLLFVGSALWLVRCLIDLGLPRRPLLEPNLNAAGLSCLAMGL